MKQAIAALASGGGVSLSGNNTWTGTQTFRDNKFEITDDGDTTKKLAFQCSGITTGTTRTATWPNQDGTVALTDSLGMRNKIINGGMQVAQRAAATFSTVQAYGAVDRFMAWAFGGAAVSGSITQATGQATTTGYALHLSGISCTTGFVSVVHRIEARNAAVLNGKTVYIKCRVKHDFGSAQNFRILIYKPGSADTFYAPYSNTLLIFSANQSVANNTWTDVVLTTTLGSSDATNGLEIIIDTTSSVTISSKNIYVGDFQLEEGSVATPFESRPIGTELALCQRYYSVATTTARFGSYSGIQYFRTTISCPVAMRASPTVTKLTDGTLFNTVAGNLAYTSLSATQFGFEVASSGTGDTYAIGGTASLASEL
ncbi:hypothetical protein FJY94_09140 [Candidatus Kaiserbacteria bacterium]|nr:hypothetical protein [Candidatus Kaiserbacteria bacterium]